MVLLLGDVAVLLLGAVAFVEGEVRGTAGGSSDLSVAMMSISPNLISGLPQMIALAAASTQTRRIRPPRPSEAQAGEVCGQQVEW